MGEIKDGKEMGGPRRKHTASFKAKVALEATRNEETVNDIGKRHGVHPVQVSKWKKELLAKASEVFTSEANRGSGEKSNDLLVAQLYEQIGRLKVENDFLKKKSTYFSS